MTKPQHDAPIRLTLLTGFLGSGKTTILNRLLREPGLANTAVVVNEFGEVGIDGALVETASADGLIELSDGCLCCSVRGELVDTLALLAARTPAPERVVVETTGIADPTPILAAMMADGTLGAAYALDGVVCVVDALAGPANLEARIEARRQLAVADRVVLTKTDLAEADAAKALRRAIAAINGRARLLVPGEGALAPELLDCGLMGPDGSLADPRDWLGAPEERLRQAGPEHAGRGSDHDHDHGHGHGHEHSHDHEQPHGADDRGHASGAHRHDRHAHDHHGIASFALLHDRPIAADALFGFLDLLRQMEGERLLRLKGMVDCTDAPGRPLVLHGVRGYLHPPATLPAWPRDMAPQTRLVLIGEGLNERRTRDLFAAFTGEARVDAPDRAALEDNPLAVAGMRFGG